jgi:hypothetical protein
MFQQIIREIVQDIAFDEPVTIELSSLPVRTVDQAAQIVRSHLQAQFTMQRLTTLLMLERAADGLEIAEARQAFCTWANKENWASKELPAAI